MIQRYFHISPDRCGEQTLAKLFEMNGYPARCHMQGRLAEDIAWSRATGTEPLTNWPHAKLFSGLYRIGPWWRPPLEGWRSFELLDRYFPGSVFILTTRSIDAWLMDRLTCDNGATLRNYAAAYQMNEEELLEFWAEEWESHIDAVQAYFGEDPRLIRVDMEEESPQELCDRLERYLPMRGRPPEQEWPSESGVKPEKRLTQLFDRDEISDTPADEELAAAVARFCLGATDPVAAPTPRIVDRQPMRDLSSFYCEWDGDRGLRLRDGTPAALRIGPQPGYLHDIAVCEAGPFTKLRRAEGIINDSISLGRHPVLRMDMEDSRWIGSPYGVELDRPVLCYNRRNDAENIVLWPWPGRHNIGMPGFQHGAADKIPFEEKQDRLVWRGMISGAEKRDRARPSPVSHVILSKLGEAGDDEKARQKAWKRLCRTSRMDVVRRYFDHPDFDIRVVLAWNFRHFEKDPLLAPYCDKRQPVQFFHQYRYQLCMAGYDTGSNFIPQINTQSVMLKEEDGWEVFYSGHFKPWKHYIPLERYCVDLEDKLAWARKNPNECKRMSAEARAEVARLSNPATIRSIKARILDGLAAYD